MLLQNKTDETKWATNDRVFSTEQALAKDITGSFITLYNVDTGEQLLYIWPYFADNAYDIVDLDYKYEAPAPTLYPEIEAADLMSARSEAEEMGRIAGQARREATQNGVSLSVIGGEAALPTATYRVSNNDIEHDRLLEKLSNATEDEIVEALRHDNPCFLGYTFLEALMDKKVINYGQLLKILDKVKEVYRANN